MGCSLAFHFPIARVRRSALMGLGVEFWGEMGRTDDCLLGERRDKVMGIWCKYGKHWDRKSRTVKSKVYVWSDVSFLQIRVYSRSSR